ncbi:amino acid permease [Priestia megaterium]|uniref:amino acid permease n=1 Tax=Priestia megaterium TaxID=1404 RepID=UPI002E1BCD7D|nr:amino acid permease [Priestia megaterium]MED4135990.1 amino acid permease [Priestia megaterium]
MKNLFKKKSVSQLLEENRSISFKKTLGAFDLTLLGIGATIGTGVLVLTGLMAANDSGPAVILSFMLAAIVCGFAALCYAEFTSTIPFSGSVNIYLYITIGEFAAHLMGWVLLSVYLLTTSAVAGGWSAYFNNFLKSFGFLLPKELITIPPDGGLFNLPAIAGTLFITFILSRGTKESKKVNNFMVIVKLSIVVLFIIVGIFHVQPMNWTPFMPYGISGVFVGSAAVFFAFLGFDALATSAEEVKNPQRNLPIGIISSLIVAKKVFIRFWSLSINLLIELNKKNGNTLKFPPDIMRIGKNRLNWLRY